MDASSSAQQSYLPSLIELRYTCHSAEDGMAVNSREIRRLFSPLQIGFIADCVEPLSAGSEAGWALELLADRPELEVIPIERDGAVLGVISRHALEGIVESALKRFGKRLRCLYSSRPSHR
ncbi:hypothetical protein MASR2M78_25410 [Treponema sp.]